MKRITSMALLGLALTLPVAALAGEPTSDTKVPEAAIVAAGEDAVVLPAAPSTDEKAQTSPRRRNARYGSGQSEADFRFQNPYAFPTPSRTRVPRCVPHPGTRARLAAGAIGRALCVPRRDNARPAADAARRDRPARRRRERVPS